MISLSSKSAEISRFHVLKVCGCEGLREVRSV